MTPVTPKPGVRAGSFLAWARADGRLLPLSIPLRFFAAASLYHVLAWAALWAGAETWPYAPGAPGWPLAALHLVTLGVLVMTVLGAGTQLLPVATLQAPPAARLMTAIWWLYTPGVALLVLGMAWLQPVLLTAGALAVSLALLLWCAAMVRNLAGARGLPGVVVHGWSALASLLVALAAAAVLVAGWLGLDGGQRMAALALHRVFAPWGFMGMLALGFSYILVPMFTLADTPRERHQLAVALLSLLALVLAALGFTVAAALCGSVAALWHLLMMRRCAVRGLRRMVGPSILLVRLGWAGLVASLLCAVLMALWPDPRWAGLFGLSLIGIWLLSFVLGLQQRIVPFLASMHGAGAAVPRRAPTPSTLTHAGALRLHAACHTLALALLALAIGVGSPALVRAGAAIGALGAAAYAGFIWTVWRRMQPP